MAFRRKMLQCDYCARNAIDLLQQVHDGSMSFDRTIKTGTTQYLTKNVIRKRLPENITTINKLLKVNQSLFKKSIETQDTSAAKPYLKRIHRNRRKIATLLEELSLRTSRIQPMRNKLHGICQKMRQLEETIDGRRQQPDDCGRHRGRQAGIVRPAGTGRWRCQNSWRKSCG